MKKIFFMLIAILSMYSLKAQDSSKSQATATVTLKTPLSPRPLVDAINQKTNFDEALTERVIYIIKEEYGNDITTIVSDVEYANNSSIKIGNSILEELINQVKNTEK